MKKCPERRYQPSRISEISASSFEILQERMLTSEIGRLGMSRGQLSTSEDLERRNQTKHTAKQEVGNVSLGLNLK